MNEKLSMMSSDDSPDTLSGAQALVKKHQAFEIDLQSHQSKVDRLCMQGKELVAQKNYQADVITSSTQRLKGLIEKLTSTAAARKQALNDKLRVLQFSREADSIEAWIEDKEPQASSTDYGKDLPSVQSLIAKQETLDAAMVTFEPRVAALTASRNELSRLSEASVKAIAQREGSVQQRWRALLQACDHRKVKELDGGRK